MSPDFLLAVSTAVQAVATIVLVLVTIFYAIQTKKTVDSMDRSSKAEFLPIIMIGTYRRMCTERSLMISLLNVGKGLAKRPVKVVFPGVAPIYLNSMIPTPHSKDDKERVEITYDIDYVLQLPEADRRIVVHYLDIFGRDIRTEAMLIEKTREENGRQIRHLAWDAWYPVIP